MELRQVDLGGPVTYADFGGDGTPLVLVHGLGGSHHNWLAVGDHFARRYRTYAIDLAGFGYTPDLGQKVTVEANRRVLDRFLAEVAGEPAILVGNSMGGLISMWEAAESPARVRRAILVDPAAPNPALGGIDLLVLGFFLSMLVPGVAEAALKLNADRVGPRRTVRRTLYRAVEDFDSLSPELVDAHVELYRQRVGMPWSHRAMVEASRSLLQLMLGGREQVWGLLPRVSCPVLVIHGERDRVVPQAASRELVRRRPDWDLAVLDGVGHIPMMEAPRLFCSVVDSWLRADARVPV